MAKKKAAKKKARKIVSPAVAVAVPKSKYERESAKKGWSGMEKGYPPPEDVKAEYTTATDRVFAVKEHLYLAGKYPQEKLIFPLN